jgi:hypothetical protein
VAWRPPMWSRRWWCAAERTTRPHTRLEIRLNLDPRIRLPWDAGVLAQLQTFTDARVERYWQLLGVLRGQPPFPPAVSAFEWLIASLRARP